MRVIVAEESILLREGLARLLADERHEVVAGVGDAATLLATVDAHRPDVVIAAGRMPPTYTDEGLKAALEIRARWPEVSVLVLSQYVETTYVSELAGAELAGVGYLLKNRVGRVGEFLEALAHVGAGGTAFDPEVVRQLVSRSTHVDSLTEQERDVLVEMAQGFGDAAIAEHLEVSRGDVEKHAAAIFDKLGVAQVTGDSSRTLALLRHLGA